MLGQPVSMLLPPVIGFKLHGKLREGCTATDLVLTITQILRKKGVVGKFVEFYGTGLSALSLADRATVANMAPEYGATMGFFPVDQGNPQLPQIQQSRAGLDHAGGSVYQRAGACSAPTQRPTRCTPTRWSSDLAAVTPSMAGPKRPQDRVELPEVKKNFHAAFPRPRQDCAAPTRLRWPNSTAKATTIGNGAVVIAAITSCTNTSNPSVMLAAGLVARKRGEARTQGKAVGKDEPSRRGRKWWPTTTVRLDSRSTWKP
ncbi:MAG: aconitase family protein [Ignavibacteriota bacterium]